MTGKNGIAVRASLLGVALIIMLIACTTTENGTKKTIATSKLLVSEEPTYQAVSALVAMGDMKQAVAAYEKEYANSPTSATTQALYANLLLAAGQTDKAREVLLPLAAANPHNADIQYDASLVAAAVGDRQAQLHALDNALKAEPDHSGALSALGELQLQDKKYDVAENSFDRSLQKDPRNFVAILGKAAVLSRTDRLDQAQAYLDKAIALQPEYGFAWSDRARVEAERNDFVSAEADMGKAVSLEPNYPWHYLDRGRILARAGKIEAAIADFSKVLDLDPKLFLARAYRAQSYQQMGNWPAAKADFELVLKQRPDYFPAYESLALAAWQVQDWNTAATWFEKVYDSVLKNQETYLLAGLAIFETNDKAAYKAFLDRVGPKLKSDGLYFQVLRYLQDPNLENTIVSQVTSSKNGVEKAIASLGVGISLLKLGRQQTGVLFLQNVVDSLPASAAARQIATWILDEYKR